MDVRLHELAERFVYHSVPLDGVRSRESLRYDVHMKMPTTIASPGMADMMAALIGDLQLIGRKGCFEARADFGDSV